MMDWIFKRANRIKKLIKDGFAHILVGNTLVKAISLISSICVVRILSKSEYGELAYVDNLMSYVLLLSGFGMSTSLLKFVGPSKPESENLYYTKIALKYGSVIQFSVTIAVILIVLLRGITFQNALPLLLVECLYPTAFFLLTTVQSVVRAYRNNKLFAKMAVIQSSIVFAVSVAGALLIGKYGVPIAKYLGMSIAAVPGVVFLKKVFCGVSENKTGREEVRKFVSMSAALMVTSMFSSIIMTNEMFIINHVIKDELVTASYKAGTLIPSQLTIIANSVIVYMFPIVGDSEGNRKLAYSLIKKAEFLCLALVGTATLIGVFANPLLIKVLYGAQYLDSVKISNVYWVVCAINAGVRMIPLNLLPAIGKAKFCAIMSIASCVIHAGLDYYLIGTFGVYGAVYAAGGVYLVSAIIYWIAIKRACKAQ